MEKATNATSAIESCCLNTAKTTTACQSIRQIFQDELCHTMADHDGIDFYSGVDSSLVNSVLYSIIWLMLVTLWPLRHWSSEIAYDRNGFDLVIHR